MSNAWYEVLSVLHLMAMLSLSQANLLLLPRTSADGYQPKVSEGAYPTFAMSSCTEFSIPIHVLSFFIYYGGPEIGAE